MNDRRAVASDSAYVIADYGISLPLISSRFILRGIRRATSATRTATASKASRECDRLTYLWSGSPSLASGQYSTGQEWDMILNKDQPLEVRYLHRKSETYTALS